MKIITILIPKKESKMLCDCMVEMMPGLVITGIGLFDGQYGRFIKGPAITLEGGKHKEFVKFEGDLKEELFNLVNDCYQHVLNGDEVNCKVLNYR